MSERINKSDVLAIFETYIRSAQNVGYDTDGWNIKITTGPLSITAARGLNGPAAFESLPGLFRDVATNYRDAYNAIKTAARLFQDIERDRPISNARPLFEFRTGGRYGTTYVDAYYDIDRDGTYKEQSEGALFDGMSYKAASRIVSRLNEALRMNPIQPKYGDPNQHYATRD